MLIAGGVDSGGSLLADTELLDLGQLKPRWTPGPPLTEARANVSILAVQGGRLLLVGKEQVQWEVGKG